MKELNNSWKSGSHKQFWFKISINGNQMEKQLKHEAQGKIKYLMFGTRVFSGKLLTWTRDLILLKSMEEGSDLWHFLQKKYAISLLSPSLTPKKRRPDPTVNQSTLEDVYRKSKLWITKAMEIGIQYCYYTFPFYPLVMSQNQLTEASI